ncbi:MAG: energy transducer TonB [Spirochaetia bacterium]|nr:energy transducer TonB [Spirochaetia bacterium]
MKKIIRRIDEKSWGIMVSLFFHGFIFISLFVMNEYSSAYANKLNLDFSIVYDLVPKGNSLDKAHLEEKKEKVIKKKEKKEKALDSSVLNKEAEKIFGQEDGEEGVDAAYIKENLSGIKAKIGKKILYPLIAQRMGWEGKAVIMFLVDLEGEIIEVKLKESSGFAVLDNSALDIINSLSGLPKPQMITWVTVPINYSLN